jgi:SAM-dependent methyltransferase
MGAGTPADAGERVRADARAHERSRTGAGVRADARAHERSRTGAGARADARAHERSRTGAGASADAGARAAARVSFVTGDARSLPFPGGEFDAVRCERVLCHLADPARAVAEFRRVTRPGGLVVALEPVWEPGGEDGESVAAALAGAWADLLPQPRIGARLSDLFRAAGLREIVIQRMPWSLGAAAWLATGLSPSVSRAR